VTSTGKQDEIMDAELSAALIMFDDGDPHDLIGTRDRLWRLHLESRVQVPASVAVRELAPSPGGPPVGVRVYEPLTQTRPAPVLIWLHGGAFAYGFAAIDDDLCGRLAADTGFMVLSPEYRLCPENPFPAGFDDAYATLEWVAQQAKQLKVDPRVLAVGGSSAGAAIAAGLCQRARDTAGPQIGLQILSCPALDDRLSTRSMRQLAASPVFTREEAKLMWSRYLTGRPPVQAKYAAPARTRNLADLPPALILTAERDPLRDEGLNYARRLINAGVSVELHHAPGTFHSFDTIAPTAGISQRVYRDYVAALQRCRDTEDGQNSVTG
jgi:acetyl esterase